MEVFRGESVCSGIAAGRILVLSKKEYRFDRQHITDTAAELVRYEQAKKKAAEELADLYERALAEMGEADAAVFEAHQMMLEDPGFSELVKQAVVTGHVNAESAVSEAADHLIHTFSDLEDVYTRARAADIQDVSERLLAILTGCEENRFTVQEPVIVVADDLTPSETVQLPSGQVLAFVTVHGSANSHTAILARTRNLPALVSTELTLSEALNGREAIVDGFAGCLYLEPDEETKQRCLSRKKAEEEQRRLLLSFKGKEDVTADGQQISLCANIGSLGELSSVVENDAAGIGLFRSEFLYLESRYFPSEEEQFQAYRTVAETMAGRRVVIRTLDLGADKQTEYFRQDQEENPALGLRAIRICLSMPELFKTQLRAILRAAVYGNVAIMYPMITSLTEIRRIREIMEDAKRELKERGIAYAEVQEGIMIETPAAVMISDMLAEEVDFFSIGTNDLTQYALAMDRQNPKLTEFYEAHHPAVLRMIRMTVENAHKAGIEAGICGELGADPTLTEAFVRMGVDMLSVPPGRILSLRRQIREMRSGRETEQGQSRIGAEG